MPTYELMLLVKKLPTPQLKDVLKKTAQTIFQIGGVLRSIENLGFRRLPYRMKGNEGVFREANYFVYNFDSSKHNLRDLYDTLARDMNVVRKRIYFVEDKLDIEVGGKVPECDIHVDKMELSLRPHVQEMVKISKIKANKRVFQYGGGRDYDPLGC